MSDTQQTTERKTRTITLTDRPPVKIVEDDWPIMADAKDWQGQYDFQSPRTWRMIVRQHRTDGRTLVYGIYSTQFQGERNRRGGELLTPPADLRIDNESFAVWPEIVRAIRRVGTHLEMPPAVIDACIADLPAEEI